LLFESKERPGVPLADVEEVSNYVAAIRYGISRLKTLPVSLRMIRDLHRILLKSTSGKNKDPGEFRRTQNWIGGSRPSKAMFVPPPPNIMNTCLHDLEKFIHEESGLPALVKIALIHVQFETIHPFLDGNGRIGRLLITLLLMHEDLQKQPLLYLSLYLKNNRETYYALLQKVRTEGAWEEWVVFFLKAVIETGTQAAHTVAEGAELFQSDITTIKKLESRRSETPLVVHQYMQKHIITTVRKAAKDLKLTNMTVTKALINLCQLKILKEVTGKSRGRIFVYDKYLTLLDKGTEPL
jgi:Fic family protein